MFLRAGLVGRRIGGHENGQKSAGNTYGYRYNLRILARFSNVADAGDIPDWGGCSLKSRFT